MNKKLAVGLVLFIFFVIGILIYAGDTEEDGNPKGLTTVKAQTSLNAKASLGDLASVVKEYKVANGYFPFPAELKNSRSKYCTLQGPNICADRDFIYIPFNSSTAPAPNKPSDCDNTSEKCTQFVIYSKQLKANGDPGYYITN